MRTRSDNTEPIQHPQCRCVIIIDDPIGYDAHVRREILPEERAAVRAARTVMHQGPQRVVVNNKGEAASPTRTPKEVFKTLKYVFIRDDGWTVGCSEQHRCITEELWRGDWVGRLELVRPSEGVTCAILHVYSQQGFEYKVGTIDAQGRFIGEGLEHSEEVVTDHLKPMTLEERREWMRRGCPTNEEK